MGQIQKHTPTRNHGRLLTENYGKEQHRLNQFSLEDEMLDELISILLGINVGLDLEIVDPTTLDIFDTPVMPNIKITKNPVNGKYCFVGSFGGKHSDFQHPVKCH